MKCYLHGGFKDTAEYFDYLKVINNAAYSKNSYFYPNAALDECKNKKNAEIMGYSDSTGGFLRYDRVPTRVQILEEARDAFVHQDYQTPMYHPIRRIRNSKGETIGIEIFRTNTIKQFGLNLLAKIKTLKIKLI